jgi:hypothetical protein
VTTFKLQVVEYISRARRLQNVFIYTSNTYWGNSALYDNNYRVESKFVGLFSLDIHELFA